MNTNNNRLTDITKVTCVATVSFIEREHFTTRVNSPSLSSDAQAVLVINSDKEYYRWKMVIPPHETNKKYEIGGDFIDFRMTASTGKYALLICRVEKLLKPKEFINGKLIVPAITSSIPKKKMGRAAFITCKLSKDNKAVHKVIVMIPKEYGDEIFERFMCFREQFMLGL